MPNTNSKKQIRVDDETWELFKKSTPKNMTAGEYFHLLLSTYLTKQKNITNVSYPNDEVIKALQEELILIKEYVTLLTKGLTTLPRDPEEMKKITFSPSRFDPLIKEKLDKNNSKEHK